MSDAERLLRRLGAELLHTKRHRVYLLGGERFTLRRSGKDHPHELHKVRMKLRRMGFL